MKFMHKSKVQKELKFFEVFIYSRKNDDFEKYDNVFYTLKIA